MTDVPTSPTDLLASRAARVPGALRALAAIAVVLGAVAWTAPRVLRAEPSPDELTWLDRYLVSVRLPSERTPESADRTADFNLEYGYDINHPALSRIVYGTILRAAGVTKRPEKTYDYGATLRENQAHGNFLSDSERAKIRAVNLAVFAVAALVVYLAMYRILGNRILAAAGTLPVILDATLTADWRAVVPYPGADTLFFLMTVVVWAVWLRAGASSLTGAVVLGMAGGFVTTTKANGAFLVAGIVLYYAVRGRGLRRLALPLVAGMTAVAVFLILNPIYFGGGFPWMWRVFHDTLWTMGYVKADKTAQAWGQYTRWEIVLAGLPYVLFSLPALGLAWRARRTKWLAPTAFWALSIILGNLAFIYMADPRYTAPARVAFLALASVTALSALQGAARLFGDARLRPAAPGAEA